MFPYSTHPLHIAPRHSQSLDVEASQHLFSHRELDAICGLQEGSDSDGLAICQYIDPLINIVPQAMEESINRLLNKMNYPHPKHFRHWFCSPIPVRYLAMYKTYFFAFATGAEGHNSPVPFVAAGERETFLSLHWTWSKLCGLSLSTMLGLL